MYCIDVAIQSGLKISLINTIVQQVISLFSPQINSYSRFHLKNYISHAARVSR